MEQNCESKKLLVIEGDEGLREATIAALSSRGRTVDGASSANEFRRLAAKNLFDLAVVEINLPDDSGFAVVRSLRKNAYTRIIILTERDTIADRVEGYTNGADIYMIKPTPAAELLAAVESLLRRSAVEEGQEMAGWRLDDLGNLAAPDGAMAKLNSRQSAFVKRLMGSPGRAVNRDELRKVIGITKTDESGRALDMFVRRLRSNIEEQLHRRAPIETVSRQGFVFWRF